MVQPVCPQEQPSTAEYAPVSILYTEEVVEQLKELQAPVTICSAVLCQHWQIEWYASVRATQRKNQVAAASHSPMQQNHTWAVAAQVLQLHVAAAVCQHIQLKKLCCNCPCVVLLHGYTPAFNAVACGSYLVLPLCGPHSCIPYNPPKPTQNC